MTVVHLCRRFWPHRGGVETHVWAVSHELIKLGHQVIVITEQHDPELPLYEEHQQIAIHRIPHHLSNKKLPTWRWLWAKQDLFMSADVIQIHDLFWWIWPVLHLIKSKIFTTFHGWEGQFPVGWQAKLQRWVAAQLSQQTIHVGAWIQEFYWDRPTAITYGGVAKSTSTKNKVKQWLNALKALGTSKSLKIVFVGRLESENEIKKYLELVDLLKKQGIAFQLSWVGYGSWSRECAQVGTVTGAVAKVAPYLVDADIVWSASYLSMLEAQALGKVVAAFYSHPLKQRYLETYPGSPQMLLAAEPTAMAAQLATLLKQAKRMMTLQQQAAAWAQTQTWSNVTKLYLSLWQKK